MSTEISEFNTRIKLVEESLKNIMRKFSENPANFFYEEDIRSLLFSEIRNRFENKGITVGLRENDWFSLYDGQRINPVRAEYGIGSEYSSLYNISEIDIAILSDIKESDKGKHNYLRACDIIIELKYNTRELDYQHKDFIKDINKIKCANKCDNFLGLAICFDLYNIKDEKEKIEFLKEYKNKNINFELIEKNKLSLSGNASYAVYVTPTEVYIYVEKE